MLSILAIETATEACSAALFVDGKTSARFSIAPQQHANLILPMCDELMHAASISAKQLSAIAFGRGPGSFTGVRIAAAIAQGIATAHDLPIIAVSTLQALAQAAYLKHHAEKVLAGIDARMSEIYWGMFTLQHGVMEPIVDEVVAKATQLPIVEKEGCFGAGSAWLTYHDQLQAQYPYVVGRDGTLFPSAEALLPIALQRWQQGRIVSAEQALPVYLRNDVVYKQ